MTKRVTIFETTPSRVFLALMAGAGIGTTITTGQYLIALYQANGPEHFQEFWLSKGARASLLAYPVWFGFIALFGGPCWILLHKLRLRHWFIASGAAAIVSFLVILSIATRMFSGQAEGNFSYYGRGGQQWQEGVMTSFGWKIALLSATEFAVIGAIVGFTIWAVAYRRSKE